MLKLPFYIQHVAVAGVVLGGWSKKGSLPIADHMEKVMPAKRQ